MSSEPEVERIVHENAGLIRALVGKTVRLFPRLPGGYEREDLESFGLVGLVQAARTFDPNRGVQFSTYAYRCIENAISGALERANTRQVDCVSLSILIGEDSDTPLEDQIAEDGRLFGVAALDAEETAIIRAQADELKDAIRLLPTQHAEIIWDVYFHQMPLNEVARKMKLSPQRVQAVHAKALKMLRRRLKSPR
jgi:RNA polymerase sigma factor (sigma-70 family)